MMNWDSMVLYSILSNVVQLQVSVIDSQQATKGSATLSSITQASLIQQNRISKQQQPKPLQKAQHYII